MLVKWTIHLILITIPTAIKSKMPKENTKKKADLSHQLVHFDIINYPSYLLLKQLQL